MSSGAVVFALPPKQTAVRYGALSWELARLFLVDGMPKNAETWVIAQAVRYIKRCHPDVRMLVSYADPSAGHQGVIYKAANWKPDGCTDEGRKTPRFDYVVRGSDLLGETTHRFSRAAHKPEGVGADRLPRVSKLRFIYPL